MVIDYKKYAINAFLTEMYCNNNTDKGQSKHKDLTERALYEDKAWHQLRETMRQNSDADFASLSRSLPFSLKAAASQLHVQFKRYMEIEDLDARTEANIQQMFQHEEEEIGKLEDLDKSLLPVGIKSEVVIEEGEGKSPRVKEDKRLEKMMENIEAVPVRQLRHALTLARSKTL